MKSLRSWFYLAAMAGASLAYANNGVDAYRKGEYDKAALLLTNASADDNALVEYYKGRMRLYGYGFLKNNTLGLNHLRNAAEKGNLAAQNILARYELLIDNAPEKALYWFKKAADSDDTMAQMYTSAAYLYGYGTKKSAMLARRYYIAAAKNGNPIAQDTLAGYFLASRNSHNRKLGLIWLNKSVEQGNPYAQIRQGKLYAEGKLVKKDTQEARKLFQMAINQGSIPALYQMAKLELQEGDIAQAKMWFTKAAEKNDSKSQRALAKLYLDKENEFNNPHTAFLWMLKAAQNNSKKAQLALVDFYKDGIGVAKNEHLAAAWKKKAAESIKKKEVDAKVNAARWLSNGHADSFKAAGFQLEGILSPWKNPNALKENTYNQSPQMVSVTRDQLYKPQFKLISPDEIVISDYYNALAKTTHHLSNEPFVLPRYPIDKLKNAAPDKSAYETLFGKAILGNANAQFKIGQMYEHGIIVDKDSEKALTFYQRAADQKDLRAEYNIGLMYLEGHGVEKDYKKAESWLKDAAFKGNAPAQYTLARLKEQGYRDEQGKVVIARDNDESIAMYHVAASNDYGPAQYRLAQLLVDDSLTDMSVAAQKKHNQMIKQLYQEAVDRGIDKANLPLAFFNAMDSDKEKQQKAFAVASTNAEKGDKQAALLLGLMYDRGIGTEKQPSKAIHWYQKTTDTPVGAFIVGTYLSEGKHINQDKSTGRQLLEQSADAGFSYGNLNLAVVKKEQGEDFLIDLNTARALGNSTAGLLIADYYLSLGNDGQSMKQARDIYQTFADKQDKEAQLKLAYMHEQGLGGKVDIAAARQLYSQAAAQGNSEAQYLLGRSYLLGQLENKPDYKKARQLMGQAKSVYSPAAIALGFINETVDDDYRQAFDAYRLAVSQNNPIGQFNLGLMYEMGKGMPVDYAKARALYLKAAKQNHSQAMVQLGKLAFNEKDKYQAFKWYEKAAQSGDSEALYQLGLMSETGVATNLDAPLAVRYYKKSAEKGNTKAMLALARMYQYGQGVPKDNKKAIDIYERLAGHNNPYAQFQLATFYYDGIDGKSNPAKGRTLLLKAKKNGYQKAGKTLQWLDAQSKPKLSYIEPLMLNQVPKIAGQPAELMYLDAMNEWNRGDETLSRMILDRILLQFPHYTPAKRAYEQLFQAFSPSNFS